MIKADKDLVQLHGDTVDLLVELALTVRGLYEAIKIKDGSAAAEAKIRSAIALGLAAEEETEKPANTLLTLDILSGIIARSDLKKGIND